MNNKCEKCIVKKFTGLQALTSDQLKCISDGKITRTFKKGDVIFDEGDHLKGIYCVRFGIAKLSKLSTNGKDQIIKFVSNGEVLGQRSVIAQEPANLRAVAVNDMDSCFIPKKLILDNLQNNTSFTLELLQNLAHELKEADDVIVNISQKPVKNRIAETLLHLENSFGVDSEGFMIIQLSREDISNIVGTATESCIRMLSELKKEKLIETSGKRIKIINRNILQKLGEGINN
ncbi:MAG: Crp/Fnr family transcriptional regulator [Flavobacteriaceae bacterium]|nr:Crp/Fnr family transcriptional regulator [Flavobacteriaceae bacterium]